MDNESRIGRIEPSDFPPPKRVLDEALSKIHSDGSVTVYDEEEDTCFRCGPYQPVGLDTMPEDIYALHMLQVARSVYGTAWQIARWPEKTSSWLESLATYLTAYRHSPEFLQMSISLGKVDENGLVTEPRLPPFYKGKIGWRK